MKTATERILAGFVALLLTPPAAMPAATAVQVAVPPELAGVMRAISGATAARPEVSSQSIVWQPWAIRNSSHHRASVK